MPSKKDKQLLLRDFYSLGQNFRIAPLLREAHTYQRSYKKFDEEQERLKGVETDYGEYQRKTDKIINENADKIAKLNKELALARGKSERVIELTGTPLKAKPLKYEIFIEGRESIPVETVSDIYAVLQRYTKIDLPMLSTFKTGISKKFKTSEMIDYRGITIQKLELTPSMLSSVSSTLLSYLSPFSEGKGTGRGRGRGRGKGKSD